MCLFKGILYAFATNVKTYYNKLIFSSAIQASYTSLLSQISVQTTSNYYLT